MNRTARQFSDVHPGTFKLSASQAAHWQTAFRQWYESHTSPNTRQAYLQAWRSLLDFCGKPAPAMNRLDIARWSAHLKEQGLAPSTIRQRVCAVSSFFNFVCRNYWVEDGPGDPTPLHHFNPAGSLARPASSGKRVYPALSPEQARDLLEAIDLTSLQGKRDYALFLAYLTTGRRNSEVRTLKVGDFEFDGRQAWYRWRGKGRTHRDECPLVLWHAVRHYLAADGRLEPGTPDQYLFRPLNDNATRLPNVEAHTWTANRPLSAHAVRLLLKKYGRGAGLDPTMLNVGTLRRTAALLRLQAGEDLEKVASFLDHASVAITKVMLHSLAGQAGSAGARVQLILGLPTHPAEDTHA